MTQPPSTYDCPPTLTDTQVLEFCKQGFLMLESVVPDEVNQRAIDYLNQDTHYEPMGILEQDWFIENVICNSEAVGVVRSLLGRDFLLPVLMSNHRRQCPWTSQGGWHVEGGTIYEPGFNHILVFYLPQDTPVEMGPTEVLPGSHHFMSQQRFMAHLGNIKGAVRTAAPAGSIFMADYGIWHRAAGGSGIGTRDMLKYMYWRTTPPTRDWLIEPDFDLAHTNYEEGVKEFGEQFRTSLDVARLFVWLTGKGDHYKHDGGQAWPLPARRIGTPFGFPAELSNW